MRGGRRMMAPDRFGGYDRGSSNRRSAGKSTAPDGKNKIKDLQNFLSISPLQVFN